MSKLRKIVYLSDAQYETLVNNGSITSNGQTVVYSSDDLYITPSSSGSGRGTFYGICNTNSTNVPKVAVLTNADGFELQEGTMVVVKFNAAAPPSGQITLQIAKDDNGVITNLTNAYPIKKYGTTDLETLHGGAFGTEYAWMAGAVVPFIFDGSNWIRFYWNNTDYAILTAVENGTAPSLVTTGEKYTWNNKVNRTGDTMTGPLVMGSNTQVNGSAINFQGSNSDNTATRTVWMGYANGANSWYLYDSTNGKSLITSNGSGATNFYGNASTATKATQDGSGNVITSTYVKKSGDTMTGDLTLSKSAPTFKAIDSTVDEDFGAYLSVSSDHMRHGVFSTGYSTEGTAATFTSDRKWMVYRDKNGNIILNGTANKATQDGSGNTITSTYVKKAGDTMTGPLINSFNNNSTARHFENVAFYENNSSSSTGTIKIKLPNTTSDYVMINARIIIFDYNANSGCELLVSGYMYNDKNWYNGAVSPLGTFTKGVRLAYDGTNYCILLGTTSSTWNYAKVVLADIYTGYNLQPSTGYSISLITSESGYTISSPIQTKLRADQVWGAVWNDYAEMRNVPEAQKESSELKPGMCVHEVGDGTMTMSINRLERGCKIISDTFGFNIGETEKCKTPIAISGRVLVYINEGRETASSYIGWPVCSGPNGTVSIMTEEEEEKYPSRIIGTISEIPNYDEWGTGNVKVDGRIWIYVK